MNKGIFGKLLQAARDTGTDFIIHAYSKAPYKCMRDSYEVAWGSRIYGRKRRHNAQGPMICRKFNQPLTNPHLLGRCKYNAKLLTSTHNNAFKLLHDLLEANNGGRWPIVSMDLGSKPVKDFQAQTQLETSTPQED